MPQTLFFDLFFTLISPFPKGAPMECEALSMTQEEWERIAETEALCARRDRGDLPTPKAIMDDLLRDIPHTPQQAERLLSMRTERLRRAVTEIEPEILSTLRTLKARGHRLCLISNADVIDLMHWRESPLDELLEEAIFSCRLHARKPEPAIFDAALSAMHADAHTSVFIGDGGSSEHQGARAAGMHTVLSEHFLRRPDAQRARILPYVDWIAPHFSDLPALLQEHAQ